MKSDRGKSNLSDDSRESARGFLARNERKLSFLAFVAGLFEIIPFIGPWLAAVPAIFFGFLQSPIMGVSVIILYIIIQELENHLIVPKVMSKAVGLNPLIVIIVILIGARLSGITGALIAVPVATAISVFLKDFMERRIEDEIKLAE